MNIQKIFAELEQRGLDPLDAVFVGTPAYQVIMELDIEYPAQSIQEFYDKVALELQYNLSDDVRAYLTARIKRAEGAAREKKDLV